MVNRINLFTLIAVLFFAGASGAMASSVSSVGGPDVTKDKTTIEMRTGFDVDNDSAARDNHLLMRAHVDYGFTDFYAARLVVSGDKRDGEDFEYSGLTLENRFDVLDREDYGFDAGFRLIYSYKDGARKPDTLAVRLLEQIPYERWQFRFNQDLVHAVGEDSVSGLTLKLQNEAAYRLDNGVLFGLDSLNDFGRLNNLSGYSDQSHRIGPVAKGKLPFGDMGLNFEAGYLVGVSSSAPDHAFKFFIGKTF